MFGAHGARRALWCGGARRCRQAARICRQSDVTVHICLRAWREGGRGREKGEKRVRKRENGGRKRVSKTKADREDEERNGERERVRRRGKE